MPIYWDAGPAGAVEGRLLTETEVTIEKPAWDAMRFGMGCISQEDFGWLKGTLEKLCSEKPLFCDAGTKKAMKKFFDRSEKIAARNKR